jgi:hypothetical protein
LTILKKSGIRLILREPGTKIQISKLHPNISKQFKDSSGFMKDLSIALRNHYGYIIQQGFRIALNGDKIKPLELSVLTTDEKKARTNKLIKPFVYSSLIEDVEVEIIIGFYRPPASEEEIQNELAGSFAPSESDNAGITVICNDRVVLYCDKSFLTGWGESPVPKYHTQFISIGGVVHFRSTNPINLPVTTTKRGLDTSSVVYATAKNRIKEGLRYFTAFTNDWKTSSDERTNLFKSYVKINVLKPGQSKLPLIRLSSGRKGDTGKYQIPNLPKPDNVLNGRFVIISYTKEREKVEEIRNYFFDGKRIPAAEVGAWCFDKMHSQVE